MMSSSLISRRDDPDQLIDALLHRRVAEKFGRKEKLKILACLHCRTRLLAEPWPTNGKL
jgi:hypothetical protein